MVVNEQRSRLITPVVDAQVLLLHIRLVGLKGEALQGRVALSFGGMSAAPFFAGQRFYCKALKAPQKE